MCNGIKQNSVSYGIMIYGDGPMKSCKPPAEYQDVNNRQRLVQFVHADLYVRIEGASNHDVHPAVPITTVYSMVPLTPWLVI